MPLRHQTFPITTSAGGAATVLGTAVSLAKLYAIEYQPGTLATGATLTVTCEDGVYSKPLLTLANAGTSNLMQYPRDLMNAVADGSALTGAAGGDRCQPVLNGVLKVAIASGGNALSGTVIIYYDI